MPVSLIVGPPNSGRVGEVVRRLRMVLDRDPVLVVPTADDTSRFERVLCESGDAVVGASITTFSWLAEDVARALGVQAPPALSRPQRLALVRAAIGSTPLRLLRRSAERPGFAPALDALIAELQAALVGPDELAASARDLDDGEYEAELATLYRSYVGLRDRAERSDAASLAAGVAPALRTRPADWGGRPVFLYGFDDLTRVQLELVAALATAAEVTVAVTYDDRAALTARAGLLAQLTEELGAEEVARLEHRADYAESALLAHLDSSLFEPEAEPCPVDDGLRLLECAGALGEAEAIGVEIARLLAAGEAEPDEIVVVLRRPANGGELLGRVLRRLGIPVAVEAKLPLARTAVGRGLIALCRAASPTGTPDDLLAHLRADPSFPAGLADRVERGIARGEVRSVDAVFESWESPPRHLARLRSARGASARLRALAAIARALAETAHRRAAPLAGRTASDAVPLVPTELRAGGVAEELLAELATAGELEGCEVPGLEEVIEAIEGAEVPLWRGPTDGRVRVLSPYRVRAQPARHLFLASLQEGEFPSAMPADPLLSEGRRSQLGIAALRRREAADEERYLFHACVSRPTEGLHLSWRSCDDEGGPLARSPFVDEVLDLVRPDPEVDEPASLRRRGLEHSVLDPDEAPTARELARALAARGFAADHDAGLASLAIATEPATEVRALLAAIPDPDALPGPLQVPEVLAELGLRRLLSSTSLEGWLECSYRWFVEHELRPERLEPTADPLWVGGVVHAALRRLYAEAPGDESIPRPGDVSRWKGRFGELLDEEVEAGGGDAGRAARRIALARTRAQVEAFLEVEAESETVLRPHPALLERRFGHEDDGDPGALELGDGIALRGSIDRVDLAPDGSGAVIRDYKTGATVQSVAKFAEEGVLQVQLYMLAARERLGLEPIAGLYQPLGATGDKRRPRGMALAGDERLEDLGLVRTDRLDGEDFQAELERARAQARAEAERMRGGDVRRDPLGGRCPTWCTHQTICRLERALGPEGGNGENGQ